MAAKKPAKAAKKARGTAPKPQKKQGKKATPGTTKAPAKGGRKPMIKPPEPMGIVF